MYIDYNRFAYHWMLPILISGTAFAVIHCKVKVSLLEGTAFMVIRKCFIFLFGLALHPLKTGFVIF